MTSKWRPQLQVGELQRPIVQFLVKAIPVSGDRQRILDGLSENLGAADVGIIEANDRGSMSPANLQPFAAQKLT